MKIAFITTNKHKFAEAEEALKSYPVELEHLVMEYAENHDSSLEEIAAQAATELAGKLERPVIVEDTGLFFEAYSGFPGALPKFVFQTLGYAGIFKLLAGANRAAYFKTIVGYGVPGSSAQCFEGIMSGTITETIFDEEQDVMPYDRIFIPQGKQVTISQLSLAEKNKFSQRGQAFRKFGEYIASIESH